MRGQSLISAKPLLTKAKWTKAKGCVTLPGHEISLSHPIQLLHSHRLVSEIKWARRVCLYMGIKVEGPAHYLQKFSHESRKFSAIGDNPSAMNFCRTKARPPSTIVLLFLLNSTNRSFQFSRCIAKRFHRNIRHSISDVPMKALGLK
eukprot:scaffold2635_cov47-Cyclotella_meneghiniana.AAC.8